MLLQKLALLPILLQASFASAQGGEVSCSLSGKAPLSVVDDRFLSVSVDPAALFRLNVSSPSLQLMKHLGPAFVRIAGPSSEFMQFSEDEKARSPYPSEANGAQLTVTPKLWEELNDWFREVDFTPIYALNDELEMSGDWRFLFNISDRMNLTCYWQLGYDCQYKSIDEYKKDLMIFRHVLDDYSALSKSKVVDNNLQRCFLAQTNPETVYDVLAYLDGAIDAFMWEQQPSSDGLPFHPSMVPMWLIIPKSNTPVTFSSALVWAKQIGEAAKIGYQAVFRQPRLFELLEDTPIYWTSLLHKMLMGNNVLEVKMNSPPKQDVYVHCTKKQSRYFSQGSITILAVNSEDLDQIISVEIDSLHPKGCKVYLFILTSDVEDTKNIYLNNELLTIRKLDKQSILLIPRSKNVRFTKTLSLSLPPKSIGFFVVRGARVPACMDNEPGSYESLNDFYDLIDRELDEDKEHYNKMLNRAKQNEGPIKMFKAPLLGKRRKPDSQRAKLEVVFVERPLKEKTHAGYAKKVELELTDQEIARIFRERARSAAAESNITVDSEEVDFVLSSAAKNLIDKDERKQKRFAYLEKFRRRLPRRYARDINMDMLQERTKATPPKKVDAAEPTDQLIEETYKEILGNQEKSSQQDVDLLTKLTRQTLKDYYNNKDQEYCPLSKYVDERLEFLMEPTKVDQSIKNNPHGYHTFYENLNQGVTRKKRNTIKEEIRSRTRNVLPRNRQRVTNDVKNFKRKLAFQKRDARKGVVTPKTNVKPQMFGETEGEFSEQRRARLAKRLSDVRKRSNAKLKRSHFGGGTNDLNEILGKSRAWKPEDILQIKEVPSYSVEVLGAEDVGFRDFNQFKVRRVRDLPNSINLEENMIEDHHSFSEIHKFLQDGNKMESTSEIDYSYASDVPTEQTEVYATNATDLGEKNATAEAYDSTQVLTIEGSEQELTPTNVFDMIIYAVNHTVNSFMNIGEKITKAFLF